MKNSTLTTASFKLEKTTNHAAVAGTVNVGGNTATFTPTANLAASTQYTATITTAAQDAAGNALATTYSWNFITTAADNTPPTVSITSPSSGATGIALNASVSATFSEAMSNSTINSTSFTLTKTGGGASVVGVVSVSGTTATFNPSADLDPSTQYTANVSTAAKDTAGNAIASPFTWNFTTAAATPVNVANLDWDAVTDPSLSGYRVYYGTSPGTYFQAFGQGLNVGNVPSYTVTGLNSGTRYYFAVTAVDTSGNESNYSNEVFKDIP